MHHPLSLFKDLEATAFLLAGTLSSVLVSTAEIILPYDIWKRMGRTELGLLRDYFPHQPCCHKVRDEALFASANDISRE